MFARESDYVLFQVENGIAGKACNYKYVKANAFNTMASCV
jgi:hypothetical protein